MSSPVSGVPLFAAATTAALVDNNDWKMTTSTPQPDHEVIWYHAPPVLPTRPTTAVVATTTTTAAAATARKSNVQHHHDPQQQDADDDDDDDDGEYECSICLETLNDNKKSGADHHHHAVTIKACGHTFHQSCITDCLVQTMKCPNCRTPAGGRPQGPSPSGTMTLRPSRHRQHCPGFATDTTTIEITYSIPPGVQRSYHDHPGQRYSAITRTAYLPDNANGRALANRLKYAFDHGLTFRVGTSLTTGQTNCVTWASIHHKTSLHGGPHGFPDPNYLANCHKSLDALHVPSIVHDYDGVDTIVYTMPSQQLTAQVSLATVLERWRRPPPPPPVGAAGPPATTTTTTTTVATTAPPPPPPQGRSPSGKMTIERSPHICPGFVGPVGCFRIIYSLPAGTQSSYHPHPHRPYPATRRYCYLPDTVEGLVLLRRLKYAFAHGLTFDVGTSLTTGRTDQIIWSTIPHKTSLREPGSPFSFPDPYYLVECHAKLDQAGVP